MCSPELPLAPLVPPGSGLKLLGISQSTLGAKRERDWRKRRAGETLGVEERIFGCDGGPSN